jgi:hypothetical protein
MTREKSKSQAQKFNPRKIQPMPSATEAQSTPLPAATSPPLSSPTEKLTKQKKKEKKREERNEFAAPASRKI